MMHGLQVIPGPGRVPRGVICLHHLIREKQMVKCSKAEVRRLKTALRWKIPAAQRQRIQMVLLREGGMTQPAIWFRPSRSTAVLAWPSIAGS